MRYSDDFIEEVRSRNSIVDVVGEYVRLTRRGSGYTGLCPFHNEKTPSFSVSPSRQMYHCFGCGVSGDVFGFIMEYENNSFTEAVQQLAARAGLSLPVQEESEEQKKAADEKAALLNIQKEAAKYFYWRLRTPSGKAAMDYLTGRGLTAETIKNFGLGFSDRGKSGLYRHLKETGATDAQLKDSGLFTVDAKTGQLKDKFWNRVMYPIMDVNKRVIGFGGRVMGDAQPKYMNSPDTKLFDKSRNLYGLYAAKAARKKNIILCEGYMDVISMHQAGFTNAVASLGTALTSAQANLLHRYTEEVLLLYDSDNAGKKAAIRALGILRSAGITGRVVNLLPYKDPDELIQKAGAEELQKRLDNAENGFMFEVRMMKDSYNTADPAGRSAFHKETAKMLLAFPDEIERNSYLESVARTYSIDPEALKREVGRLSLKAIGAEPREAVLQTPPEQRKGAEKKEKAPTFKAEKLLLSIFCAKPDLLADLGGFISPEDFQEPLLRSLAEKIFVAAKGGRLAPLMLLNGCEDAEDREIISGIIDGTGVPSEPDKLKTEAERLTAVVRNASLDAKKAALAVGDLTGLQKILEEKKKTEQLALRSSSI
ncbi:MAG: DNA primase [Eubacterium sp.]|nr:DNA primase [Eubacterium sp.]